MSTQQQDMLLSLQSSLRNALATFGPTSPQYRNIKYMVDELATQIALDSFSISSDRTQQEADLQMRDA
ncbi:hypothetical protein ACEQ8H_008357 [Pleosporales sp. CAS-2024a]